MVIKRLILASLGMLQVGSAMSFSPAKPKKGLEEFCIRDCANTGLSVVLNDANSLESIAKDFNEINSSCQELENNIQKFVRKYILKGLAEEEKIQFGAMYRNLGNLYALQRATSEYNSINPLSNDIKKCLKCASNFHKK